MNRAFQKHWFCAAICKDGNVVMCDSDSPAEFLGTLENSILAWVDHRTAELQTMNNRTALLMTYLTVLGTAVLIPNTLATIFGNSAFAMGAQDIGWYVTLLVVATVLATALTFWWVKKSGLIPKKMD